MAMTKVKSVLLMFGVVALSLVFLPQRLPAQATPGQSNLSEAQQASLSAMLAETKSYAELIKQAVVAGMDCEEIVVFLCGKTGNDPAATFEIVYAAITGGCDAGKVVSGALRAGANLQTVVRAARAAGADREAIIAAATSHGATPVEISNAFAGTSGGGATGGPGPGGPSGGAVIGGGGGGGGAAQASPYKP